MPLQREIRLIDVTDDGAGALDTGLSHAIVLAVGAGDMGETFRIHRTDRVVAFGRRDVIAPGYRSAVAAARSQGFAAVERLAGGRAAAFHTGTLGFSWAIPAVDPRSGVEERFALLSGVMSRAFQGLGVDARIGEVPGEYCPGAYSVGVGGRVKVMGVGQRLVRGAAHVGGVVVVSGADTLRAVLRAVYEELDIDWDPTTVGALDDFIPGLTPETVRQAILGEMAQVATLTPGSLSGEVAEMGRRLSATHRPPMPVR